MVAILLFSASVGLAFALGFSCRLERMVNRGVEARLNAKEGSASIDEELAKIFKEMENGK